MKNYYFSLCTALHCTALHCRFVKWLTKNRGLQGIPPSAFFCQEHKAIGEDYIRFCFIKHQDSLEKAKTILTKWREELGS